jgi:hypothetical protein
LLQSVVVANQRIHVFFIELRDNHIDKSATFIASSQNNFVVGRRNHHQRNKTYMIGEPVVILFVSFELLFLMSSDSAINFLGLPIRNIISPLNHAHIGIVTYDLRIDGIDMTFTKRKIIYGIEQIGFSHAIVADKAIYFWR